MGRASSELVVDLMLSVILISISAILISSINYIHGSINPGSMIEGIEESAKVSALLLGNSTIIIWCYGEGPVELVLADETLGSERIALDCPDHIVLSVGGEAYLIVGNDTIVVPEVIQS